MKRKLILYVRFVFLPLLLLCFTQYSFAQESTNFERLHSYINEILSVIMGTQNASRDCVTEVCKKQKLLEKCREKSDTLTPTELKECKNISSNPLAQQLSQLAQQKKTKNKQARLLEDLLGERAMLEDNAHDAHIDQALREIQTNPPPRVPQSVINQNPENIIPGQSVFLGDFVCKQDGGGSFNTRERPRNQGGLVQDELFYAIANAAKSSGVSLTSLGCYNNRNIAGTNTASQHSTGSACDILPKGQDQQKTAFMVFFLANTGNFNTVGSYASRGFDHSHLGADCRGTWCPYQKGSGLEPWKELAFRTVFQACGQTWNSGARPAKKWVQDCAKKAVDKFCQNKN